jgi:hypothetical protein
MSDFTLEQRMRTAVLYGTVPLRDFWQSLTPEERKEIGEPLKDACKVEAGCRDVFIQRCKGMFPGSSAVSVRLRAAEIAAEEAGQDAEEADYAPPEVDPFAEAAE